MKTALIVSLALFPCFGFAGTSPTTTVSEANRELAVMTTKLKLSPSQQNKIRPILVSEFSKRKSIEDNTTLSDKQKHDQIGTAHRAACQQIKTVFTPEQMAQIDEGMKHPSPTSSTSK